MKTDFELRHDVEANSRKILASTPATLPGVTEVENKLTVKP